MNFKISKKEFLDGLKQSLIGNISNAEMNSKIDYYNDYFASEKNNGRNEEDICKELGDPKLIAKTIIDTPTRKWVLSQLKRRRLLTTITRI